MRFGARKLLATFLEFKRFLHRESLLSLQLLQAKAAIKTHEVRKKAGSQMMSAKGWLAKPQAETDLFTKLVVTVFGNRL